VPDSLALQLEGVTKRFGSLVANDRIDLELRRGEIHALLGENGAGKSTLMNVLYGLHRPDEGRMLLDGEEVHIDSPSQAIGMGIGMVHQHFMLIPVMTVAENIVLASEPTKGAFLDVRAAEHACASCRSATASTSIRPPGSRTSRSASSSAWRSCACCTAARRC
jgi:simple sugar transport system ATP-binding protein